MNPNLASAASRPADPAAARLLAQYRVQQAPGAPEAAPGATLELVIDDLYRMRLDPLPGGGVRIAARLRALPQPGLERDRLLAALGRLACGTMLGSPCACVIDPRERAAWLQLVVAAASTQDIDDGVGELANALAFWTPAAAAA